MKRLSWVLALLALMTIASGLQAQEVTRMGSRPAPAASDVATISPASPERIASIVPTIYKLAPITAEEKAGADNREANQVGIGREIANSSAIEGTREIRLSITSPLAAYVRAKLSINGTGRFRISAVSPSTGDPPVAMEVIVAGTADSIWSPITKGDTQDLLIEQLDAEAPFFIRATRVSHLLASGLGYPPSAAPKDLGDSASCQIDFKCVYDVAPQEMRSTILAKRDSIVLMLYTTQAGGTYVCTGTLLNSANYPTPYLLTAAHCTPDASSIASLNTVWFYHRDVCNSGPPSSSITLLAGGAVAVSIVPSLEIALLRLNQFPPQGARYSGWDSSAAASGTAILAAHHPQGDALKASFGTLLGTNSTSVSFNGLPISFGANTFHVVDWQAGIVEPGSSGSSLFTYDPQTATLYSRGALTGGSAACNAGTTRSYYSRLQLFMPYVSDALLVAATEATTTAVEYYHAGFGHYFVTAQLDEISGLDGGAFGGVWQRTGQTWKVWTSGTGKADVCRFFTTAFAPKSSHFYTANAAECAAVKNNPAWTYEKLAFKVSLPTNGICAAGSKPLYRLYNSGMTGAPNHRYTTSTTIRDQMLAGGFVQELDNTVCVPN